MAGWEDEYKNSVAPPSGPADITKAAAGAGWEEDYRMPAESEIGAPTKLKTSSEAVREDTSDKPWWQKAFSNLQLKLPGAHTGPDIGSAFRETAKGIPVTGEHVTQTEGMSKMEKERPIESKALQLWGGANATAPLFAGAEAMVPQITGYGAGKNLLRFGRDVAVPGTLGSGINIADVASDKGGMPNADEIKKALAEGYGAAGLGTTLGRVLGPGVNELFSSKGQEALPDAALSMMSSSRNEADAALARLQRAQANLEADPFRSRVNRDAVRAARSEYNDARANVETDMDATVRRLGPVERGETASQVAARDPELFKESLEFSRPMQEARLASRMDPNRQGVTNAILRGVLAEEAARYWSGGNPWITGGVAGLAAAAPHIPKYLPYWTHNVAGRHLMQNPATQALIQQLGRKPETIAPGVAEQ